MTWRRFGIRPHGLAVVKIAFAQRKCVCQNSLRCLREGNGARQKQGRFSCSRTGAANHSNSFRATALILILSAGGAFTRVNALAAAPEATGVIALDAVPIGVPEGGPALIFYGLEQRVQVPSKTEGDFSARSADRTSGPPDADRDLAIFMLLVVLESLLVVFTMIELTRRVVHSWKRQVARLFGRAAPCQPQLAVGCPLHILGCQGHQGGTCGLRQITDECSKQ